MVTVRWSSKPVTSVQPVVLPSVCTYQGPRSGNVIVTVPPSGAGFGRTVMFGDRFTQRSAARRLTRAVR